jgi:hypothetical protein
MEINKTITAIAVAIASIAAVADASAAPDLQIQREAHYNVIPNAELGQKRIFIVFEGSPKMTRVLKAKLQTRGYATVEKPEEADEQYRFSGIFMLSGAGKDEARGKLGELLESSVSNDLGNSPNYGHQNVDLLQIGVSAAYSGIASAISITDMVRWLGQKTGVAGRFNELLTGDPRGFCLAESCSKYTSTVIMNVKGNSGHWWVQEKAQDSKVVLDLVVADAVENMLKPFYDIRPQVPAATGGKPQ